MERNMKLFNLLIGILLLFFACSASPTNVNGRFTVSQIGSSVSVLLQINTDTGTDDLGGTTLVFSFDTTAINFPINPIKDIDYIFYNFFGSNYSAATVTRPMKNQVWVNIDLPHINNNSGTVVAGSPEWTDVVSIQFDIVDSNVSANLSWLTTSPFWGVFDADNSTLWATGTFEDYSASVEPISDLPTNYELSQNYPNPFNPSTKIKYVISSVIASGTKQSQLVTLKVFDILGNEVATLVNEEKEPGIYEVEFSSSTLASGIYIYRLTASNFTDTKKMVLLR
jgi:hypothetical protein